MSMLMLYCSLDTSGKQLALEVPSDGTIAALHDALEQQGYTNMSISFRGESLPIDKDVLLADTGLSQEAQITASQAGFRWLERADNVDISADDQCVTHNGPNGYLGATGPELNRASLIWEVHFDGDCNGATVGVVAPGIKLDGQVYSQDDAWVYTNHGSIFNNESRGKKISASGYKKGDKIRMELTYPASREEEGTLVFFKNDTRQGELTNVREPVVLWAGLYTRGCNATFKLP
eukprot:Hpha_TRINITY_DN31838_c0_g1::TRINITY_DN31838_c0_g1_i1::g.30060::m.30060